MIADKLTMVLAFVRALFARTSIAGEVNDVTHAIEERGVAAQVGTIIAGIVIGAALIIGLFVVATLNDAIPVIDNDGLSNARNTTVERIGDGMLLGSVVIIVLFAAVILRVLRGL